MKLNIDSSFNMNPTVNHTTTPTQLLLPLLSVKLFSATYVHVNLEIGLLGNSQHSEGIIYCELIICPYFIEKIHLYIWPNKMHCLNCKGNGQWVASESQNHSHPPHREILYFFHFAERKNCNICLFKCIIVAWCRCRISIKEFGHGFTADWRHSVVSLK